MMPGLIVCALTGSASTKPSRTLPAAIRHTGALGARLFRLEFGLVIAFTLRFSLMSSSDVWIRTVSLCCYSSDHQFSDFIARGVMVSPLTGERHRSFRKRKKVERNALGAV